jgi:serine/threonine-protein kinase
MSDETHPDDEADLGNTNQTQCDERSVSAPPFPGPRQPRTLAGTLPGTIAPVDSAEDAPVAAVPAQQGRYLDLGEIGRGGMSTVRHVKDQNLLRSVALKVLDSEHVNVRSRVQRFIEEAQITGQLEHPGIVPVHDLAMDEDGRCLLYMKLVRGVQLDEAVKAAGGDRLKPDRLAGFLQIFLKVCDAVAFAHSRGVLHRDLKPENIMVGDFGQVYVLDWGVAHLAGAKTKGRLDPDDTSVHVTRPEGLELDKKGAMVGTPNYMSPEQVYHDPDHLDERTDVFGLGAILYFIATAQAPYPERSLVAVLSRAQLAEVTPPSQVVGFEIPPGLEHIILKAMACEPAERYQSVTAVQRDVESFLHGTWSVPTRIYQPGAVIITQGEPGDAAYLIVRGRCRVLRQSGREMIVVKEFGPGDVFGEAAVFSDRPRTASVQALEEVEVMVVTKEYLTQTLGLNSWVGPFVKSLAERFCEVESQWRELERAVKTTYGT